MEVLLSSFFLFSLSISFSPVSPLTFPLCVLFPPQSLAGYLASDLIFPDASRFTFTFLFEVRKEAV